MKREDMEKNNTSKADQHQRGILDRILRPAPKDENLVRIFFWVSIISCLLLPRIFEVLAHNQLWNVISVAWLGLAVFLRVKVHISPKPSKKDDA
jgi:hypothetical protein